MNITDELNLAIEEVESAKSQLGAANNDPSKTKLQSALRRLSYVSATLGLREVGAT